jgi:chromosomal replication initiation ATPase DnaA
LVESFIGAVFAISPGEIRGPNRRRKEVAFARQVAMYLAHVAAGLPMAEVGRLFARDRTTVAHACALVEDRRDDPAFDRALAILEFALAANTQSPQGRKECAR